MLTRIQHIKTLESLYWLAFIFVFYCKETKSVKCSQTCSDHKRNLFKHKISTLYLSVFSLFYSAPPLFTKIFLYDNDFLKYRMKSSHIVIKLNEAEDK